MQADVNSTRFPGRWQPPVDPVDRDRPFTPAELDTLRLWVDHLEKMLAKARARLAREERR